MLFVDGIEPVDSPHINVEIRCFLWCSPTYSPGAGDLRRPCDFIVLTYGTVSITINNVKHSSIIRSNFLRMTHICVSKLTITGSDNGLSPGRRQAIIRTNDGVLLIGQLGTNFSEILIEIYTFSFKKVHLKMSSGKWRPFCLGLNILKHKRTDHYYLATYATYYAYKQGLLNYPININEAV